MRTPTRFCRAVLSVMLGLAIGALLDGLVLGQECWYWASLVCGGLFVVAVIVVHVVPDVR